jgi:hypothetical protein
VQDAVDSGQLLLVVELDGLDDYAVTVSISPAEGTPMRGTDGTILDGQTFDRGPTTAAATVRNVALVDGRLVAQGLAIRLSLQILDAEITLDIPDGAIQIDLSPDGTRATGLFGGGFSVGYLMEVVDANGIDDGLEELLRSLLPALAALDGEAGSCEYLSVDLQFGAVPAFFFEE